MKKINVNEPQGPQCVQTSVSSCVFGDCETEILKLKDQSVDIICIDPPYLYLKNQKLEREFNEELFFSNCFRVLQNDGFIILFGRGVSFYRWNYILDSLGFVFKEEIIWDKSYSSSPVLPISRVHETVSIFAKGKGRINNIKIPYIDSRTFKDFNKVINDVNRLKAVLNNEKSLNYVLDYLKGNRSDLKEERKTNYGTSCQTKALGNQTVSPMIAIKEGMKVKSIITESRDHYTSIHPTQKPVKLLERLISLCLPNKHKNEILVADFFAGSFSCGEACHNLGVNFKGYEIDEEYYNKGVERMDKIKFRTELF